MFKGVLDQVRNQFFERYAGTMRPIGSTYIEGPISDHYLVLHNSLGKIAIVHSEQEALQKAHDYALQDLSAQCPGGEIEDKTEFAKNRVSTGALERTIQPLRPASNQQITTGPLDDSID